MPKSIKKFISREKAKIRRKILDVKKQKELIEEMYSKLNKESK